MSTAISTYLDVRIASHTPAERCWCGMFLGSAPGLTLPTRTLIDLPPPPVWVGVRKKEVCVGVVWGQPSPDS